MQKSSGQPLEPDPVIEAYKKDVQRLIQVKRAAGRPKDFEAVAELETILEQRPPDEESL